MGYKCPKCHKDFGNDRDALYEHLSFNAECATEAFIRTELWKVSVGIKKPKIRYGARGKEEKETRIIENISPLHIWEKVNIVTNPDGSDTVICKNCGLKAKRYFDKLEFDRRYTHKIQYCNQQN